MVALTIPYRPVSVVRSLAVVAPRSRRAPNLIVRAGARAYAQGLGLPSLMASDYVSVNEALARAIADAFEALPDVDETNPMVARAYTTFVAEINAQFAYAAGTMGFCCDAWEQSGQPYRNSQEMMDDLRDNHHLFIFSGEGEVATTGRR